MLWLAAFFEYNEVPLAIIAMLAGTLLFKRRLAFLIALLGVLVLITVLKPYYAQPRPCMITPGPLDCPSDYGLPSGHAAFTSVFAVAALGTPAFYFIAPLAALVSYTRIYADFHTFDQVAAGVALGICAYGLALGIRKRIRKDAKAKKQPAQPNEFEVRRQLIHVASGTVLVLIGYFLGKTILEAVLVVLLAGGYIAAQLALDNFKLPIVGNILGNFERKGVMPFKGALSYAAGALLAVAFAPNFSLALAIITMLAFGDGASTVIGKLYGDAKLHWNASKTWKGMFAFFVAAGIAAFPLIGIASLYYAAILALVETLPIDADDNILIPAAALVLNAATGLR